MNYKLLCVTHGEQAGVGHYRQRNPHTYLANKHSNWVVDYTPTLDRVSDEKLKEYTAVQFIMFLHRDPLKVLDTANRVNKCGPKIILDLDDYWHVLPGNQHRASYVHIEAGKRAQYSIKAADFITTPVATLAYQIEKIKGDEQAICIVPNAINPHEPQFTIKPTESALYRFGWAGGSRHLEDIELLKRSMVAYSQDEDAITEWQFVVAGFSVDQYITTPVTNKGVTKLVEHKVKDSETTYALYEKVITNNYKLLKRVPNYVEFLKAYNQHQTSEVDKMPYKRIWTQPVTQYAQCYNQMDCCIIPLARNTFNGCKSQLKLIEAGFFRKPVIVSNTAPYNLDDELQDVEHVLFCNDHNWHQDMDYAYCNQQQMQEMGNRLYDYVNRKFNLDTVTETRKQAYETWLK